MFLGIDVGTSSVKAVLLSASGRIIDAHFAPLSPNISSDGRALQDPSEWLSAIDECVAALKITTNQVRSIGTCFNCSTLVPCLDGSAEPAAHAILWNDRRSEESASIINAALGLKGSDRVTSGEPAARFHHWNVDSPGTDLVEAASWILERLTGCWSLPLSIFVGRWGHMSNDTRRSRVLTAFPQLERSFRSAFKPLVGCRQPLGFWTRKGKADALLGVPVFTSGNDGMTAIYGSGYLFEDSAAFAHFGTSRFIAITGSPPQARRSDPLGPLDILFGMNAFLISQANTGSESDGLLDDLEYLRRHVQFICLLGGGSDSTAAVNVENILQASLKHYTGTTVNCGKFVGAVGAAALARVAIDKIEGHDMFLLEGLRANWDGPA